MKERILFYGPVVLVCAAKLAQLLPGSLLWYVGGWIALYFFGGAFYIWLTESRFDPPLDSISDEDIARFARQDDTARAVRLYRARHGGGFREAERAVAAMVNGAAPAASPSAEKQG